MTSATFPVPLLSGPGGTVSKGEINQVIVDYNSAVSSLYKDVGIVTLAVGDGVADDGTALQNFANSSSYVFIPAGQNIKITSTITIPPGAVWVIDGTISGSGQLSFLGDCSIYGAGNITAAGLTNAACIRVVAGQCSIKDITINTNSTTHAILVAPTANISSLLIQGIHIKQARYGILRSGGTGFTTTYVMINNCVIENCTGDGIEWNQGPNDSYLSITSNVVHNCTSAGANQGIGIGVAGLGPYINTEPTNGVKQIIIANNIVDTAGEGIHCEIIEFVTISGNQVRNILASQGGAGITGAGIVLYDPWYATIDANQVFDTPVYGIYVSIGVNAGTYTGSPHELQVSNNKLTGATSHGLLVNASALASDVQPFLNIYVHDNNLNLSKDIFIRGACNWYIHDNNVLTNNAEAQYTLSFFAVAFGTSFTQTSGSNKYFAKVINNTGIDTALADNSSITLLAPPAGSTLTKVSSGNSFTF